jgi:hypothetical protein
MKHWTSDEKSMIVREALTPGNTFHTVAAKYQLSPMTIYQWHHEIDGYIHLLQAASGTLSQALEDGEELVWIAVPDLMRQTGRWALILLLTIFVILVALMVMSVAFNRSTLTAVTLCVFSVFAVLCLLGNYLFYKSVEIDIAVTGRRLFTIKRDFVPISRYQIFNREKGLFATKSYPFDELVKAEMTENQEGVGNLILIGKDGKQKLRLVGIAHVRGLYESLPASLKS